MLRETVRGLIAREVLEVTHVQHRASEVGPGVEAGTPDVADVITRSPGVEGVVGLTSGVGEIEGLTTKLR